VRNLKGIQFQVLWIIPKTLACLVGMTRRPGIFKLKSKQDVGTGHCKLSRSGARLGIATSEQADGADRLGSYRGDRRLGRLHRAAAVPSAYLIYIYLYLHVRIYISIYLYLYPYLYLPISLSTYLSYLIYLHAIYHISDSAMHLSLSQRLLLMLCFEIDPDRITTLFSDNSN
jgi:hypothetical protein